MSLVVMNDALPCRALHTSIRQRTTHHTTPPLSNQPLELIVVEALFVCFGSFPSPDDLMPIQVAF
jgi:hypothetical protein